MATSPATEIHTAAAMPLEGILLAEELLDLAERAQAYTNAAGVAIALRRGNDFVVRTAAGAAPEVGTIIPGSDGIIAECVSRRKPQCCRDADSDSRVGPAFRAMKVRSLIVLPIPGQPQPRGVMAVIAPLPNAFQPTHTAILMTLSDIISSKLAARETPPDAVLELVDDPPPALAATPEPVLSLPDMPVVAPPAVARPAHADSIKLELKASTAEPVPAESAPADTSAASPAPTPVLVPPALLKTAPLPLVEDKKTVLDPALLSPSEDPLRFPAKKSTQLPVSSRPWVERKPKPAPTTTVAATVNAAATLTPPATAAAAPVLLPTFTSLPAATKSTWTFSETGAETETFFPGMRRFVLPGLAAAAVLILAVALWNHSSRNADIPPAVVPLPSTAALPASPPAETPAQPVINTPPAPAKEPLKLLTDSRVTAVASKPTDTKPAKAEIHEPPKPVMEIASAQPQPKSEPLPDVAAPKLALVSTDAGLPSLGKPQVVVPAPPKSDMVPATLLSRTAPVYPAIARQMGIAGIVTLNVTIGTDGSVKALNVVDGAMQLRAAAVDAVRHWRYKPATSNGKPVEATAQVQINFAR